MTACDAVQCFCIVGFMAVTLRVVAFLLFTVLVACFAPFVYSGALVVKFAELFHYVRTARLNACSRCCTNRSGEDEDVSADTDSDDDGDGESVGGNGEGVGDNESKMGGARRGSGGSFLSGSRAVKHAFSGSRAAAVVPYEAADGDSDSLTMTQTAGAKKADDAKKNSKQSVRTWLHTVQAMVRTIGSQREHNNSGGHRAKGVDAIRERDLLTEEALHLALVVVSAKLQDLAALGWKGGEHGGYVVEKTQLLDIDQLQKLVMAECGVNDTTSVSYYNMFLPLPTLLDAVDEVIQNHLTELHGNDSKRNMDYKNSKGGGTSAVFEDRVCVTFRDRMMRTRLTADPDDQLLVFPSTFKTCRQGHILSVHTAKGHRGTCDGCLRSIAHDTQVMDCELCDYFLCNRCDPRGANNKTAALESALAEMNEFYESKSERLSLSERRKGMRKLEDKAMVHIPARYFFHRLECALSRGTTDLTNEVQAILASPGGDDSKGGAGSSASQGAQQGAATATVLAGSPRFTAILAAGRLSATTQGSQEATDRSAIMKAQKQLLGEFEQGEKRSVSRFMELARVMDAGQRNADQNNQGFGATVAKSLNDIRSKHDVMKANALKKKNQQEKGKARGGGGGNQKATGAQKKQAIHEELDQDADLLQEDDLGGFVDLM